MHPERLTRQAIRLAQRESLKRGHRLSREEIFNLKVQTGTPIFRAFLITLGLLCALLSYLVIQKGVPWYVLVITTICSVAFLWSGIFGSRRYVEKEMKKLGGDMPKRVLDAISNAL
jgi:hypothetical protein